MGVMIVVALYLASTAPLLPLLLLVHGLRSDYTRLFQAAVVLQIVPIGLVFVPLGFIGTALLAYSLWLTLRRNRQFRAGGFDNPDVHWRWTREYLANVVALGLALQQKGFAIVFMELVARHDVSWSWRLLLPASLLLWAGIAWLIQRDAWALRPRPVDPAL